MPKKKHIAPAKIKYDKTHPIVSVRVDLELKKKLEEVKQLSDKSVGDILREALKVQAPKVKNALNKGYQSAKFHYRVIYKCNVCGKPLEVQRSSRQGSFTVNGGGH